MHLARRYVSHQDATLSAFIVCVSAAIKQKYTDWTEFLVQDLTGSRTAPANLLEGVSVC